MRRWFTACANSFLSHASAAVLCLTLPSHNSPSPSPASPFLPMLHPPFPWLTLPSHGLPSPPMPHLPFPCFTLPFPCFTLPSHASPSLPMLHPPFPWLTLPSHGLPSPPMPHLPFPCFTLLPMLHPPLPMLQPPFPCFTLPFTCLNLPSHASHSFPMPQQGPMLSLFMQSFLLSKTTHSYFLKLLQDFVVELSVQLAKSSC